MSPAVAIYRVGNFLHRNRMVFLGKMISYLNRILFSVWLPSSAKIGKNFVVGYWGLGTVIHNNTVIGDNCQVNQNVTIGRNFRENMVPRLCNNVYVGSGSVIFGEIVIGDNVIIGANSLVNKSIPSNSIVVGNPFRIIGSTEGKNFKEIDNTRFQYTDSINDKSK